MSQPEPSLTVVAAFDVDGTVTTRDCVVPFLRRVAGSGRLVLGLARVAHRVVPAALRRDRDTLKALATRAVFRGRHPDEIEQLAAAFAADVARAWLRDDVVARLRWHQAAGHRVVFVSASYAVYLRVLAEALGVGGVVATELAVGADGRLTGELVGTNCRGVEKPRRLHAWLADQGEDRTAVAVWAYGDSAGDEALLADADVAVWVTERVPAVPPAVASRTER